MTELSPAAQAVHQAFITAPLCAEVKLAAALEALTDQVACQIPDDCSADVFNRQLKIRTEILAIAAELRGLAQ